MAMTPETRDAIGKACHRVCVDRAMPMVVPWDDLPETSRETWRRAAEAAVGTFLERAHLPPPESGGDRQ
jgi:hypothetical protein